MRCRADGHGTFGEARRCQPIPIERVPHERVRRLVVRSSRIGEAVCHGKPPRTTSARTITLMAEQSRGSGGRSTLAQGRFPNDMVVMEWWAVPA